MKRMAPSARSFSGSTTMQPEEQPDEVVDLGPLDLNDAPITEGPRKRVERTRAVLAYMLFWLLASLIGLLLVLLGLHRISVKDFVQVSGVLLSPVVGLLGAATGYYYGRGDR